MKFLFALWDGGGAVPPELGVARRLIARGHDVRIIADPTLRDQSFAIGAGFTPWNAAPHRTTGAATEDLVNLFEGMGVRTGIDLDALVAVSEWLEAVLGRRLEGYVYRAGAWAGS